MELPRGITGFRHVDDPPLPVCDFAAFRGHCHAAARALGGSIAIIEAPLRGIETNFVRAVLQFSTGSIAVLLNSHFPVIAFAEPQGEGEVGVRFIDSANLAQAFRSFGAYEVPDASVMTAPLTPQACRNLAPVEMEEVEYWRPQRVGDVVFNFWG